MAFKRFSLHGFSSEFNIRRRVELFNGSYLVWVTLYRGKHLRRKIDEISTALSFERGQHAAEALGWEFRDQLIARYGLEAQGNSYSSESADASR